MTTPDPGTAQAQLARLLHIIPAATRDGGAAVGRLARDLGVSVRRILSDVRTLTDRAGYQTADQGADLQVFLEEDRVSIFSAGPFRRPVRLDRGEALCVALALRTGRPAAPGLALRDRLEEALTLPTEADPLDAEAFATDALEPDPAGIRATLAQAVRTRSPCRFGYLKDGAEAPEFRRVEPWGLLHAEGWWYLVGRDVQADGPRLFRIDRILDARIDEGRFDPPADVDLDAFLVDGRRAFFRADPEEPPAARVRYGPAVARWVRERWPGGDDDGGGYVVTHEVVDPGWIVRHVLQYGPDAELIDPPELRTMIGRVARTVAGA